MSRYNVNLVFNGHAHIYQRNRKSNGIISYITGGGGAKLEPLSGSCSAVDAYAIGWSYATNTGSACGAAPIPTSIAQVFHFLLVSVDGTQITVTPTDSQGRTFDVQTYNFARAPDTTPPSAPANLQATPVSATRVELTWAAASDNIGVTSYTIYRDEVALAMVGGNMLSFADTDVAPGMTYRYSVSAFDAAGNRSAPSRAVSATTPQLAGRWSIFVPIILK